MRLRPINAWPLILLSLGLFFAIARPSIAAAVVPKSVEVIGTAFRVTFPDGQSVSGKSLLGATLSLRLAGSPGLQRIRLTSIVDDPSDPDLLLYRMSVVPASGVPTDLCEPDAQGERWAFPLKGQWDANGRRVGARGLTLACAAGGAIGKCVKWGYAPWRRTAAGVELAPYHAACVAMVRANYCGDRGTTRDGMAIDFFDTVGINRRDDAGAARAGLTFEAAWGPRGAICVAHPRVPENVELRALERRCPWLRGKLGSTNCVENAAVNGQYGAALILNRSR